MVSLCAASNPGALTSTNPEQFSLMLMPCPGNDNIAGFMRSLGYDFKAEASAMAGDEQVSAVEA